MGAKTEKAKMLAGELYRSADPELVADIRRAQRLLARYNATSEEEADERTALLRELLGPCGDALDRGHEVTAIVRHPEKLPPHAKLHPQKGDVYNEDELARLVAGHEAVISAFNPGWGNPDIYDLQVKGTKAIINGVKKAGLRRLLFGGGPEARKSNPECRPWTCRASRLSIGQALATREALNLLRKETGLEWSFLSPSADLAPGQRTGQFRLGKDQMLKDENGQSRISVEDYAVAMIDEVERPAHIRQRFTVGY